MKKCISILLMLGMFVSLMLSTVASVSAEDQQSSAALTFDDWKNPFAPAADKYSTVSTAVTSINDNPALTIYPLKGKNGSWNHVTMPFPFERQKTYVISYDVAVTEQLGRDALSDAALNVVVCSSVYSSEASGSNNFSNIQRVVTYADGSSATVVPGKWNHVVATVSIPGSSGMWWEPDSIGFWEDNGSQSAASCFVIDNLVIMEQSAFNRAYPSGVTPRTDNPSVGYDKVVSDFNSTRYPALRSVADTAGNLAVTLRGDSVLTWKHKDASEANLYIPFAFRKGETYRLSLDISTAASEPVAVFAAASATKDGADEAAALQKFTSGESDSVTLENGVWKHVELILTATADAGYFVLCPDDVYGNILIDNFALSQADSYPSEMPRRTGNVDSVLRLDFEDENPFFFNALYSNRVALSVDTVEKNGVETNALRWEALTGGQAYNKVIAPYCFTKGNTYVISFDVMAYGQYGGGDVRDTQIAVYSVYQDFTLFEDSSVSKNLGTVTAKAGEWTHVSLTVTIPTTEKNSMNYLGLCEFPGNENNACFFIDQLTIAPKNADCTADTHVEGVWTVTKKPNCTDAGSRTLTCAICGAVIRTEEIPAGAGAHIPAEWTLDKEATCTEQGKRHALCTVCGERVEEVLPAVGHTPGEWIVDREATCTESGSRHRACSVCGADIDQEEITAAGHKPGSWVVDTPAAEGVEGHRHRSCTVCNELLEEETIAALPVPSDDETAPEASATTDGGESPAGCKSTVGIGFWAAGSVMTLAGFGLHGRKSCRQEKRHS